MRPTPLHARRQDWPERLAALFEERRAYPFTWGVQDCCMFAGDAALAVTGRDPFQPYRGLYATEAEGDAILAPFGGLVPFLDATFDAFGAIGCREQHAQRGDLALILVGNQPLMGVIFALGQVAVPGESGLSFLRLTRAERCWAI